MRRSGLPTSPSVSDAEHVRRRQGFRMWRGDTPARIAAGAHHQRTRPSPTGRNRPTHAFDTGPVDAERRPNGPGSSPGGAPHRPFAPRRGMRNPGQPPNRSRAIRAFPWHRCRPRDSLVSKGVTVRARRRMFLCVQNTPSCEGTQCVQIGLMKLKLSIAAIFGAVGCSPSTACYGFNDSELLQFIENSYAGSPMTTKMAKSFRLDKSRAVAVERSGAEGNNAHSGMLFRQDDGSYLSIRVFKNCESQVSPHKSISDIQNWAYPIEAPRF